MRSLMKDPRIVKKISGNRTKLKIKHLGGAKLIFSARIQILAGRCRNCRSHRLGLSLLALWAEGSAR